VTTADALMSLILSAHVDSARRRLKSIPLHSPLNRHSHTPLPLCDGTERSPRIG